MRAWIAAALIALPSAALAFEVPDLADRLQRHTERAVQAHHGIGAPVAIHAAIIHQESRWRPDAESPAGAQGLAQFMPGTAGDIPALIGGERFDPFDPRQSVAAMAAYTAWLYNHPAISQADTECDRWAMVLSAYNGGIGNLTNDQLLAEEHGADPTRWWGQVDLYSARGRPAYHENRTYVILVILAWQREYLEAGWGGPFICEGHPAPNPDIAQANTIDQ